MSVKAYHQPGQAVFYNEKTSTFGPECTNPNCWCKAGFAPDKDAPLIHASGCNDPNCNAIDCYYTNESNRHQEFDELIDSIKDLHHRKSANYAGDDPMSNLRVCEEIGIPAWKGVIVRMMDKWSRIKNLTSGVPDLVGESLEDSLIDNAVYSLMCVLLIRQITREVSQL